MRLTCPHCGERDRREFTWQGVALIRPEAADTFTPEWDSYIHLRENPAGDTREMWYHDPCGTWLVAHRNTVTHQVHGTTLPGDET